ncbi:MAG: hypothetical protein EXR55_05885 [Dehalococcoidia bacterium]|nr:hypothetical protein [Dehalococcoidia bacterium]
MIITHRGVNTGAPENTLAAFDSALRLGANAIECDARLTLDHQVVVHHDNGIRLAGKRLAISRTPLQELLRLRGEGPEILPTLEELFCFIREQNVPAFIEVKNSSSILAEAIIQRIALDDLWTQVHIIGFSVFVRRALGLQKNYPQLRVIPLMNLPMFSYVRLPARSYGVFVGWIDGMVGTERLFRLTIAPSRLVSLREYYEEHGFQVFAGVINRPADLKLFRDAGFSHVVTDDIPTATQHFQTQKVATGS